MSLASRSYFNVLFFHSTVQKLIFRLYFFTVQLLHKFCVRASDSPMKLLKVIKNPITNHLPVGCRKIAMSFSAKEVKNPRDLVPGDEPIAIVIGAMAHGQVYVIINNLNLTLTWVS